MSVFNYDELPPRPPLSVPFPLQLGDEFHLGSATSFDEHQKNPVLDRSVNSRVPGAKDETKRTD